MLGKSQNEALKELFSHEIDEIFDWLDDAKKDNIFNFYPYIVNAQVNVEEMTSLARQCSHGKEESIVGSIDFLRKILFGENIVQNVSAIGAVLTVPQYLQLVCSTLHSYMDSCFSKYLAVKELEQKNSGYAEVIKKMSATLQSEINKGRDLAESLAVEKQKVEMTKLEAEQASILRHDLLETRRKYQPVENALNLWDRANACKASLSQNTNEKIRCEAEIKLLSKKRKGIQVSLDTLFDKQIDQATLIIEVAECRRQIEQDSKKRKELDKEVKAYTRANKIDLIKAKSEEIKTLTDSIEDAQSTVTRANQLLDLQVKIVNEVDTKQNELKEVDTQIKNYESEIIRLEILIGKLSADLSNLEKEIKSSPLNFQMGKPAARALPPTPPRPKSSNPGLGGMLNSKKETSSPLKPTPVVQEKKVLNSQSCLGSFFNEKQLYTYSLLHKEIMAQITHLKTYNGCRGSKIATTANQLPKASKFLNEKAEAIVSRVQLLADIEDSIDIVKNSLYHGCYIELLLNQVNSNSVMIHKPVIVTNLYQCEQTLSTVDIKKFSKNYVVLPIDLGNYHWVMMLFDITVENNYRVYYLDPLKNDCSAEIKSQLEKIGFCRRNIFTLPVKLQADNDQWNCGVYVVEASLDLLRDQQLAAKMTPIGLVERYKNLQKRLNAAEVRTEHLKVLGMYLKKLAIEANNDGISLAPRFNSC